jgi:hypothetical protein
LILLLLLSGCQGADPKPNIGKSLLQVTIDWSKLDEEEIQVASLTAKDAAHVNGIGARLVYPNENATFTQATSRTVAGTKGVITLDVPATNQAHLYLVAVNTEEQIVFHYALAENLRLEANAVLPLTIDDFQWIEATWEPEMDYAVSVQNKHFELPREETIVKVDLKVRDPFQDGKQASYEATLIGLLGMSSMKENVNGWLEFEAFLKNPTPGVVNTDYHWLQPCVDGASFNLGNKGYYIAPVLERVKVDWK